MSTAYISIGSNLGDRLEYIRGAIRKLKQSKEIEICRASSVYETEPVEYRVKGQGSKVEKQPWFLNMILELETTLEPSNLLELLLGIENQMGRTRPALRPEQTQGTEFVRYGPRNIDLDLLLYDDLVLNSDKLTLPHPRMHQRKFVLVPLAEITPKVVHPLLKKSVEKLLEELSTDSAFEKNEFEVRLYSEKVM
ncbi:MAG: hypothetical protein AMJ89_06840 [candidate division Zixibacteria bacterium SM23_73]|nr:MAG: hypothetical protein AMJ89_06840 [candidate division Zixibacteria bacterium SM23_73]